ncbi:hypothetical protein GE061_016034, partial [Apolygus lucorum]
KVVSSSSIRKDPSAPFFSYDKLCTSAMTDQSSDENPDLSLQVSDSKSEEDSQEDDVDPDGSDSEELSERETGAESENEVDSEPQSCLEWVEFNKKVISMRPIFKSAKVQFIHRSTRSIKILRNKKGAPEQVEKNKKKADRLVQEIAYIKRLKRDVIPKFALLHSKEEVTKIVNNADSTMEYRVKAKLASTPKISKAANDYHESHPDWRDSLFKLIQLAGKNMKKKRRKIRGKSNSGSITNEENRQKAKKQSKNFQDVDFDSERFGVSNFPEAPPGFEKSDEENSDDESEEQDQSEGESLEGSDDDSPENLNLRTSKPNFKITLPRSTKSTTVHEEVKSKGNLESRENHTKKILPAKKKLASAPKEFTKVNNKKVVDRNGKIDNDVKFPTKGKGVKTKRQNTGNSSDEDMSESESNTNVDPFFMTSDNKEYKTMWKVEPADSFKNKKPNEPEFMFKNARPFNDVLSGKSKKGPPKAKVAKLDRREKKTTSGKSQAEVPLEKLHPSWQAKKKMGAVAFQGKKVVFDDD